MLAASFGASDGGLLAAVAVLIALSAVLALAETSLVRTSQARARSLEEQRRHGARSLRRLVEHPEQARQIGARAAAHIAAHHSPDLVARRYFELLSSCCR